MSDPEETWLGIPRRARRVVRAGVLLGVGLGGFFDGIVFHQILQLHHLLSAHPDPAIATDLPLNVMADGVFHAVTYGFTVAGIGLLWRATGDRTTIASGEALLGSIVLGWGLFTVVEGIVDHHLLGIHHVWPAGPGPVLLWDLAFLAWGLGFLLGGYAIVRRTDPVPRAGEGERTDRSAPERSR